jgi:hypothetical protein
MSLINDALKRASQSDRNRPSQGASPRPMKAATVARGWPLSWLLPVIVAVVLVLAGWFFWKCWETSHPAVAVKPAPASAPAAAAKVALAPAPSPAPAPVAPAVPPPPAASVARLPAKPAEPMPAAPVVAAAWPTPLTLQGIFYSKTNPLALINGKTVGPGESVGGVVVARIESDRVIVEWNGHSKDLLLEAQ